MDRHAPGLKAPGSTQGFVSATDGPEGNRAVSYYRHGPHRPSGPGIQLGVPRVTPYVKLIMIVCGAVWFLQFLAVVVTANPPVDPGLDVSPYLGVVPAKFLWVWQPFTYMFLHSPGGPFHLVFNMLMLWMFGSELERHWGSRAFLRYYLVCGVGAGIAAILFGHLTGDVHRPTIGASGAIFGLFIAYGMVFAERNILFMLIIPMKARTMAIIMFALTFFYTWSQYAGSPTYSRVSHIAHLGGAVAGFLYLKRAWRVGELYRELRWKMQRRKFKVMSSKDEDDSDRWVN
jgi:membrane associated rhomboid family serine protease